MAARAEEPIQNLPEYLVTQKLDFGRTHYATILSFRLLALVLRKLHCIMDVAWATQLKLTI